MEPPAARVGGSPRGEAMSELEVSPAHVPVYQGSAPVSYCAWHVLEKQQLTHSVSELGLSEIRLPLSGPQRSPGQPPARGRHWQPLH